MAGVEFRSGPGVSFRTKSFSPVTPGRMLCAVAGPTSADGLAPMQYAKDPVVDRSLRHSVRDGLAFSAMVGGAETYLSAFAIFLKANAPQVAVLTTLPPLFGSLAQFLAVWLGRRLGRRRPVIVAGAVLQGLTWLPLLFPVYSVPLLLLFVTAYYAGGHLANLSVSNGPVMDQPHGRLGSGTKARSLFRAANPVDHPFHLFGAGGVRRRTGCFR